MKRFVVAIAALASLAPAAEGGQEKYKLEIKARKGDACAHTSTESIEGKLKIEAGGNVQDVEMSEKKVKKYKDSVLEVEGILPTKVRRTYSDWFKEKKGPEDENAVKESRSLEGKAVVLTRKGEETVVQLESQVLTDAKEIHGNRLDGDAWLSGLPKEPVPVGHEWKLDAKVILRDFNEGGDGNVEVTTAKGTAKLEKIEEYKGAKCAVIAVTLEAEGTVLEQKDLKVTYNVKSEVYLALDSGRVLAKKGGGTALVDGTAGDEGVKLSGKFSLKIEDETTYD